MDLKSSAVSIIEPPITDRTTWLLFDLMDPSAIIRSPRSTKGGTNFASKVPVQLIDCYYIADMPNDRAEQSTYTPWLATQDSALNRLLFLINLSKGAHQYEDSSWSFDPKPRMTLE